MNLTKTWGAGALFAHENAAQSPNALWGALCGDILGINFETETPCTLYIDVHGAIKTDFSCVMPNYIGGNVMTDSGEVSFVFAAVDETSVVVYTNPSLPVRLWIHGDAQCTLDGGTKKYTFGGEVLSLATLPDGYTRMLRRADNEKDEKSKKFECDIKKITAGIMKKYEIEKIPEILPYEYEPMYRRSLALIRTNIYPFGGRLIYGERTAHGFEANTEDSLLRAVALKDAFVDRSADTCLAVAESVRDDGTVPSSLTEKTGIAPPLVAWAFEQIFADDVQMTEKYYDTLRKTVMYYITSRDIDKNNLYQWNNSGNENSPRFDSGTIISGADLSSYMYMSVGAMRSMAELINRNADILYWGVMAERISTSANDFLYDEEDGFYCDRDIVRHRQIKLKTTAGFMPLFAKMCTPAQVTALTNHISDKAEFGAAYGLPSVARCEKSCCAAAHRGAMHPADNYKVACGLAQSNRRQSAEKLAAKCLEAVRRALGRDGVVYEFYSPSSCADNALLTANGCGGEPRGLFVHRANRCDSAATAAMVVGLVNLFRE